MLPNGIGIYFNPPGTIVIDGKIEYTCAELEDERALLL